MAIGPFDVGSGKLPLPRPPSGELLQATTDLENRIDKWLAFQDHRKEEFLYPLPWFSHEGSAILKALIPRYRELWGSVTLRRGNGCLYLVLKR